MTPERLQEIRDLVPKNPDGRARASRIVNEMLDYIDLLHEDLALTRQERDHAKHQALEHRKARAQAEKDTE